MLVEYWWCLCCFPQLCFTKLCVVNWDVVFLSLMFIKDVINYLPFSGNCDISVRFLFSSPLRTGAALWLNKWLFYSQQPHASMKFDSKSYCNVYMNCLHTQVWGNKPLRSSFVLEKAHAQLHTSQCLISNPVCADLYVVKSYANLNTSISFIIREVSWGLSCTGLASSMWLMCVKRTVFHMLSEALYHKFPHV